jgi:hypothetical protein
MNALAGHIPSTPPSSVALKLTTTDGRRPGEDGQQGSYLWSGEIYDFRAAF